MEIEVFIRECEKLKSKYKNNNLTKQFLNELWSEIKHKENKFIVDKIQQMMCKPINHKFTKEDFMSNEVFKMEAIPKRAQPSPYSDLKRKISKLQFNNSLENTLQKMGVSSLVEAVEKVKK